MKSSDKEIAIVGGGIVGVMACLQLLRRGWQVTLFDRMPPGSSGQTSFGNAGSISIGNVSPLGKPGFLADGFSKMVSPNSPLLMPFSYMYKSLPWVFQVFRQSGHERSHQISQEIGELNMLSGETWQGLLDEFELRQFISQNGWLKLYESERSFEKTLGERQLMREMNIPFQVLDYKEILDHEPELSPIFSKAILQQSSLGINSPGKLMEHLGGIARANGAQVVLDDIRAIQKQDGGFVLVGETGEYKASKILIASGAWSARLAEPLGHDFPLETERGYHLFFDTPVPLKGPSINMDRYVAMSPMEGGVRITSCVELGGLKRGPNYSRIQRLSKFAKKALPKLQAINGDKWMGYRPSLPDSKPVIGSSTLHDGLYFAFGNGHLGMTQGAGTGRLIAEVINDEPTSIQTEAYAPDRFGYAA